MAPHIFFPLRFCAVIRVLVALLLFAGAALAEPRVRGTLSTATAGVGELIEYELTIEGAGAPDDPTFPQVDGLEVRGTSHGSQLSIVNANVSRRVTITYTLVAKREGKFTIPAIEIDVDGKKLKTQPANLVVAPGEATNAAGDLAFANIWVEKKTAYLGEIVPLELRLYLDSDARWNLQAMPPLTGDGFTIQPMGKPSQRDVPLAGKTYHLVTFRTVVTPGKAGRLSIGPVTVPLLVSKPSKNPAQYRLFSPRFDSMQEMKVEAPVMEMQVKLLPGEGRPKDFSGAIGKFEFAGTGTPDRVKVGEPVSMKLTIKGRGNFDRIDQPPLADPTGWTTYSAKQNFEPGDVLGTDGVKTFELPVTPTVKKNAMPVFAFSFFDSDAGKYVTLKTAAAPLQVDGEPVSASVVAGANGSGGTKSEQPKEEPKAPAVQDILANLPEPGALAGGYGLHTSPWVLFSAMFAPLPVLLGLLAWRSRKVDAGAQRNAELRREKTSLIARVRKSSDRAEVLDAAARVLQIESALDAGPAAGEGGLADVLAARKLDDAAERAVRELFEARNELLYAGGARGGDRLGESERDRLFEILATYERTARK